MRLIRYILFLFVSTNSNTLGLHQLINEPTYLTTTSANILDLIFTDSPGYVTYCGILPPLGMSKHAIIYSVCSHQVTKIKSYKKEIWKYRQADIEGLNIAIGDFPFWRNSTRRCEPCCWNMDTHHIDHSQRIPTMALSYCTSQR